MRRSFRAHSPPVSEERCRGESPIQTYLLSRLAFRLRSPVRCRFVENGDMEKFMQSLANDILGAIGPGRQLVAVDGVDGVAYW